MDVQEIWFLQSNPEPLLSIYFANHAGEFIKNKNKTFQTRLVYPSDSKYLAASTLVTRPQSGPAAW